MRFKIGDYVKVVDGFTPQETGEPVSWQGQIKELPTLGGDVYCMAFDAQTLDSLTDEYLRFCLKEIRERYFYNFGEEYFEPAKRRDNPAMRKAAIQRVDERTDKLVEFVEYSGREREMNEALLDEWLNAFRQSPEFSSIPDSQKEVAAGAPRVFAQLAFEFEYRDVDEWDTDTVMAVCLRWLPREKTAEAGFFEHFGAGLTAFFLFLDRALLLEDADLLAEYAAEIAPKIPKMAANPANWGVAKSFEMEAAAAGYDISNQEGLNAYIEAQEKEILALAAATSVFYRNYTGSNLINVQYHDGSLVKCKFSKVEADLRAGKCIVVKKKKK